MSLIFEHVSHRYGDTAALIDASLEARAGEIVCLFGPSGCGKTTLLRLAAGLETLQAGEIRFGDRVWAAKGRHCAPEDRSIGFVFQDHALFPHMTVADNVAFGSSVKGGSAKREAVERHLAAVGLGDLGRRFPHELSGGQQQRVALARALAREPEVLLLDEPFASVDSVLRRSLREDFRRALKASGAVAVLVTHDPAEAMEVGDQIAVMRAGGVVQIAPPRDIYLSPEDEHVAAAFGEAQTVAGVVKGGMAVTPFGAAPAPDMRDGVAVTVVARPHAIRIAPAGEGRAEGGTGGGTGASSRSDSESSGGGGRKSRVTVSDVRFLGPDWLVLLRADLDGMEFFLRARVPNADDFKTGAAVDVAFDPDAVFVFMA